MWLCPECVETPKRKYTFGLEAEWDNFTLRHPRFVARIDELHRMMDQVVSRKLESANLSERVIFYLGRLAVEDFNEVLLSVGNGYGVAGIKLLRAMYERVVTMMYLIRHPKKARDFLDYHRVQMRKTVDHMKNARIEVTRFFTAQELTEIESRYQEVRSRFIEVLCKRCGKTRDAMSWTKTDLATMAREVGFGGNYPAFAYFPTLQLHTTAQGIMTRIELVEGGGTAFKPEAQRELLLRALNEYAAGAWPPRRKEEPANGVESGPCAGTKR
jgi:Family of unknown function (DUF5677)